MKTDFNAAEANAFLQKAVREMAAGKTSPPSAKRTGTRRKAESPIRHMFSAALPQMFPSRPWWVEHHATKAESHVKFSKKGKKGSGFVDTLIGATAVEYEKDLTNPAIFKTGLGQVKEYCAGLLNARCPEDLIIGVLSDTVRWHIFRIVKVSRMGDVPGATEYGEDHIHLEEIEDVDLSAAGIREANQLGEILTKYIGREGARRLGAVTLADDLGFDSPFCVRHIQGIRTLVDSAFAVNKEYSDLITKLWKDFVSYLGDTGAAGTFNRKTYVGELYILTLAKLLCANVLDGKALTSGDGELVSIMDGGFFKSRGFTNLVEYDYFGWLNQSPHVEALLPVARAIQDDLRAYDFTSAPEEDLFGVLLSQLAVRSQRVLLGQECTPTWLAEKLVGKVFDELPNETDPSFIDMCCGSGTMVVEAVKLAKKRLEAKGVKRDADGMNRLAQAVTGFDIDPLAVMLTKIGWALTAREWFVGSGIGDVSIPVYHADSLFAVTPLSKKMESESGTRQHQLRLDDKVVGLPAFLLSSERRILFDALLDRGYAMAMASASKSKSTLTDETMEALVERGIDDVKADLSSEEKAETITFCRELIVSLDALQRAGRNGIWAFVLRNSYRPGLVVGQFNGLVSNPPWLALSKVADNPYKEVLRARAENYGIKPKGSSFLHIELATIFLLHAVERYLAPGAVVGCVLPETVLNAHHHDPLRKAEYLRARRPVPFLVDEIWRVEMGTFKNEAVVLFGGKRAGKPSGTKPIPGNLATPIGLTSLKFQRVSQGKRSAWTDKAMTGAGKVATFQSSGLHQGADLMPRTLVFHECVRTKGAADRWNLAPIDRATGPSRYLVCAPKKHEGFKITAANVDGRFIFDVLMSNQLTPFHVSDPAKGLLPIQKDATGGWIHVSETDLATYGTATSHAFETIFKATGQSSSEYFDKLNSNRRKLSSQVVPTEGWLVLRGAGGGFVCSAYVSAKSYATSKLVIDQTLYWAAVPTEDEAIYLTGLFNSEAINTVIKPFQPRGSFGERHVHKLADRVTPPYDAKNAVHVDVVSKTKVLLSQWRIVEHADPKIQELWDPNANRLGGRRRKLRKMIKGLTAYSAYELACKKLYGV